MTSRSIRFLLTLLLAIASGPALAEHEAPEAHAHGETKTIVLDGRDIRPSSLDMQHGDVLSFVNYTTDAMKVEFTEPEAIAQKIRCGLVREAAAKGKPAAPWALFTWQNGKLAANVPPGQFASVCSFAPGHYAFTSQRIGATGGQVGEARGVLPTKGQIEVH